MDQNRRFRIIPEGGMFSAKSIIALLLPLIAEQFLSIMVGLADTVMVTATGENAVSAVSLVDTLNFLLIQIFAFLGGGGAIVTAQYMGKGDLKSANNSAKQLLLSTFAMAMILAVPSIFLRANVLGMLYGSLDPDIMQKAQTYFLLSALSYPMLALYNGGVGILRAMGNTRASMNTSIIMNIINISGNALLIYGFKLGVAGAGTASLLSRTAAALIILYILRNKTLPVHLDDLRSWKPDFPMIKKILSIGVPNGVEGGLFQVGKLVVARIIATFTASMIAANAICGSISSFIGIPGSAVGLASLTIIGRIVGSGDDKQAKAYGIRLIALMYIVTVPLSLICVLCPGILVSLFSISPEGSVMAVRLLRLYGVINMLFWTSSFGMTNILRAAGDVRFCMSVSMVSMLALRLGMCYLFVYGFNLGLEGVWLAMYTDWIARSACFALRYRSGRWLKHKVV